MERSDEMRWGRKKKEAELKKKMGGEGRGGERRENEKRKRRGVTEAERKCVSLCV